MSIKNRKQGSNKSLIHRVYGYKGRVWLATSNDPIIKSNSIVNIRASNGTTEEVFAEELSWDNPYKKH